MVNLFSERFFQWDGNYSSGMKILAMGSWNAGKEAVCLLEISG